MQITAIILSGGKSTRMGTDKALLQINGITLLDKAIEICRPVCSEILISSNNPNHERFGYQIIPDEIKNCGPLGGIYSCLKKSETDWNFVISIDAVGIETEFISFLISKAKPGFDAIVPVHSTQREPLIALYHKSSLPEFEKRLNSGNYKMVDLIEVLNTNMVDSEDWVIKFPNLFQNVNFPEDLKTV